MKNRMLNVLAEGLLYKDEQYMAAFPSIVALKSGSFLVVFRRAPDPRWLLQARASNEIPLREILSEQGEGLLEKLENSLYHWDPRSHLYAIEVDERMQQIGEGWALDSDSIAADQDPSLLQLESGALLLASFSWYPMPPIFSECVKAWGGRSYGGPQNTGCSFIPMGCYTRRSLDGGRNWSTRNYLPKTPGGADLVPGLIPSRAGGVRGQCVEHQGRIYLASYEKVHDSEKHSIHLWCSNDEGQQFFYQGEIACSKETAFYEPSLSVGAEGGMICWMRSDDSEDRLYYCESLDLGETWTAPKRSSVIGHPPHLLDLGEVSFLSYGYRHPKFGIRARMWRKGESVDEASEITIRSDGSCTDLGYTWACPLPNQKIAVVYYFTGADGIRNISYSLLQYS